MCVISESCTAGSHIVRSDATGEISATTNGVCKNTASESVHYATKITTPLSVGRHYILHIDEGHHFVPVCRAIVVNIWYVYSVKESLRTTAEARTNQEVLSLQNIFE